MYLTRRPALAFTKLPLCSYMYGCLEIVRNSTHSLKFLSFFSKVINPYHADKIICRRIHCGCLYMSYNFRRGRWRNKIAPDRADIKRQSIRHFPLPNCGMRVIKSIGEGFTTNDCQCAYACRCAIPSSFIYTELISEL